MRPTLLLLAMLLSCTPNQTVRCLSDCGLWLTGAEADCELFQQRETETLWRIHEAQIPKLDGTGTWSELEACRFLDGKMISVSGTAIECTPKHLNVVDAHQVIPGIVYLLDQCGDMEAQTWTQRGLFDALFH